MAINQFVGQLMLFPFGFAPKGWAQCNGQLLQINTNQVLFSLLGTTFGGDGVSNFALPNLQGRTPVGVGAGIVAGQTAGEAAHTLLISEVPGHTHSLQATSAAAGSAPIGNVPAATSGGLTAYGSPQNATTLNPASVTSFGSGGPHENRSPYLVLNWCISLVGIYPSRN